MREDALAQNLEMRPRAMSHLDQSGVIRSDFPSGVVARSREMFGPRSKAGMEPVYRQMNQPQHAGCRAIFVPRAESPLVSRSPIEVWAPLRKGRCWHEVV